MAQKVLVAGATGLVGSAIVRRLKAEGGFELLTPPRGELDLLNEHDVKRYFGRQRPDTVILAAALVGGIEANRSQPMRFLVENLRIQDHVMTAAAQACVQTLMFLGSSCIYPRECPQPMKESAFMTGPLEPTNESYAVAKIAGIRLAQSLHQEVGMRVILPMPSNIYGPGDHFDLAKSHVLSALVMRYEQARRSGADTVTLWGTGSARREFLHCDDLADACLHLLTLDEDLGLINVGSGTDISIAELSAEVSRAVGYSGQTLWDPTKPDGMPRKLLDVQRLSSTGWNPRIPLNEGLKQVIEDYRTRFPSD